MDRPAEGEGLGGHIVDATCWLSIHPSSVASQGLGLKVNLQSESIRECVKSVRRVSPERHGRHRRHNRLEQIESYIRERMVMPWAQSTVGRGRFGHPEGKEAKGR